MNDRSNILLILLAVGIWVLILQNAGIIPPIMAVHAQTRVVDVNIVGADLPLDINLHSVVGRELIESSKGMYIGVSGVNNTLVPIQWGEVSITP